MPGPAHQLLASRILSHNLPPKRIFMESPTPAPTASPKMLWLGRILSGLTVWLLLFSAGTKLCGAAGLADGFALLGWPLGLAFGLGVLWGGLSLRDPRRTLILFSR